VRWFAWLLAPFRYAFDAVLRADFSLRRRVWRGLPELDGVSDEECDAAARQLQRESSLHQTLSEVFGALVGLLAGLSGCYGTGTALQHFVLRTGKDPSAAIIVPLLMVPVGLFLGTHIAANMALRARLKRRVLELRCPWCRYDQTGLPMTPNRSVTCPECGRTRRILGKPAAR
jgi:ribosomal protein S27E